MLLSWREFVAGKRQKTDVADFAACFVSNFYQLHNELEAGRYIHGGYSYFKINDQKPRDIHKASVRDRIVHHAIHRALYPYFDRKFIFDSYSCRVDKGTHRALARFATFARRESRNHADTVWVLKCDIKKCFASIDHDILKSILKKHIARTRTFTTLASVIDSFHTGQKGKGIPLGNLTSQLFVNIYLNELDQVVKRIFRASRYIRYADDFIVLSRDRNWLEELLPRIGEFLNEWLFLELRLEERPIRTVASGVDFLGWVHFPDHRVLRNKTKWKMLNNLERKFSPAALSSYLGLLSHGNAWNLAEKIKSDTMRSSQNPIFGYNLQK